MPDQPPIAPPERAFISHELRPDATIREEGAAPPAPRDVVLGRILFGRPASSSALLEFDSPGSCRQPR